MLDGGILSVREAAESQLPNAGPVPTPSMGDEKPSHAGMRRHAELVELE